MHDHDRLESVITIAWNAQDIGPAEFDAYIRNEMVHLAPLLRTITPER